MLLTTGTVIDFLGFVQILCWIILPILVLSSALTTYLHYRKKKKNLVEYTSLESDNPELYSHHFKSGEYILFDHSKLVNEYKKRISSNQAKFSALKQDFSRLESKYSALAFFTNQHFVHHKNSNMENYLDQLPQHIQEEINLLVQEHAAEKKEMNAKLEQLGRSYKSLEEENESLLEQIKAEHGSDVEKDSVISKWKEENSSLKERIAEQDYLKDILEEKKAQIAFLQNQLEQRIVNNHQAEVQRTQLTAQIADLKQIREGEMGAMQLRVNALTDELQKSHSELERKKIQFEASERALAYSEEQWKVSQIHCQELEEKLQSNKITLRRLYADLSACIETEEVPVIQLRSEYTPAEEG